MCMTCGCFDPEDDHGDDDNLVRKDFVKAAEAEGITVADAIANAMTTERIRALEEGA